MLAVLPATAGANLDQIKQAGALRIGTEGTYAPFTFHDDAGALVGFDVEIGQESPSASASRPNSSKASGTA